MQSGHIAWQSVAVGVGLVGIAAYYLWPATTPAQVAVEQGQAMPELAKADAISGLPTYLSVNRPGYAIEPKGFPDMIQWANPGFLGSGLTLPDGLVRNADGTITGGNYVGGNYVGGRVTINNPGVIADYSPVPQDGSGTTGTGRTGCC